MALRQVFQGAGLDAGRPLVTVVACALALAALGQSAPAGARAVELELVLGVDTSMSVGADEFALQMAGYAAAFRHPEVLQAIQASNGGIAVTLVQWADSYQQAVSIDWTWVGDQASAAAFAERIARMGRRFVGPGTALATALAYCLGRFEDNGFEGRRRTVDVSGDGRDNRGPRVTLVRALAMTSGITVNGLAILNDEPFLDRYYERQVIAGADAFVVAAADYQDFAAAIVKKLVREIAGPQIARAPPDAPRGYSTARAVVPAMRRSSTSSTIRWNAISIPVSVSTRS
jgi:Protein of unknown function (DUF1194)